MEDTGTTAKVETNSVSITADMSIDKYGQKTVEYSIDDEVDAVGKELAHQIHENFGIDVRSRGIQIIDDSDVQR